MQIQQDNTNIILCVLSSISLFKNGLFTCDRTLAYKTDTLNVTAKDH